MTINDKKIKELLDNEVSYRNINTELNYDKPDPLMVASRYDDEYIILLCALFAYGNAKLIVKFFNWVFESVFLRIVLKEFLTIGILLLIN